jgi:hypothetical protein
MDVDLPIPREPSGLSETYELASSVQILTLPEGIYSFTISGSEPNICDRHKLILPSLQIGIAPVRAAGKVELLTRMCKVERWLVDESDLIVARIVGGDGAILLTSVRTTGSLPLSVNVNRLNAAAIPGDGNAAASKTVSDATNEAIRLCLLTHIRHLGDIEFEGSWAGWPGQRLWIEGFAISSVKGLPSDSIEYSGVVASGFQTPWLRSQELCGSRGGGMPLLGYAVRPRPDVAEEFECIYRGRFVSGATVGPMRNGELCSSTVSGDPLEAVEVQVVKQGHFVARTAKH